MDISKPCSWELENECLGAWRESQVGSQASTAAGPMRLVAGGRVRGKTEVESVSRDQTIEGLGSCLRDFRLYIYIHVCVCMCVCVTKTV